MISYSLNNSRYIQKLLDELKRAVFIISLIISIASIFIAGNNIAKAQLTDEQDSTVSVTVIGPTSTATAAPTATSAATATPTASPLPTPAYLDTTDYSTNTNDLTNNANVAPSTNTAFDESSVSALFNGSNYLSIPDADQTDLDGLTDFTIEFWVNFTSTPVSGNSYTIVSKDGSGGGNRSYNIELYNDSGTLKLRTGIFETDSDYNIISYTWTPEIGLWYHVAISYELSKTNADRFNFYIDGYSMGNGTVEKTAGSGSNSIQNSGSAFYLGRGFGGKYFIGKLDDVRIWNDIRTSIEIADFYDIELGGTESGLVAYWPFESVLPVPSPTPRAGAFRIYGYAPADSKVYLNGIAVDENITSGSDGYFVFNRLFFPTFLSYLSGNKYPELCLFSMDSAKRITSSVCIPPLPLDSKTNEVGPILLSPTLDIEKGNISNNEQTKATGKTVPNSEVRIFLARESNYIPFFDLVKDISAYSIPLYQIESNSDGDFEFNLPQDPDIWRLYAGTKVLGEASAKSNTLVFNIYSPFYQLIILLISIIKKLILFLMPYRIYLIILLQFVIVFLLIRHLTSKRKVKKSKTQKHKKTSGYISILEQYKEMLNKKR